jgi:hypothetical protein
VDFDIEPQAVAFGAIVLAIAVAALFSRDKKREKRDRAARVSAGQAVSLREPVRADERDFRRLFPELQPYFHPEKAILFVREARRIKAGVDTWRFPAGFNNWRVVVTPGTPHPVYELRNWRGKTKARFGYQAQGNGAILHIGEGELTLDVVDPNPHASYDHPTGAFRWSAKRGWTFERE